MTISERWRLLFAANVTASSFATLATQLAEPSESTAGVIKRADGVLPKVNDYMGVMPFGVGTANQTFKIRHYAWFPVISSGSIAGWINSLIAQVTCTLCAAPGLAGHLADASQLYCDGFTIDVGNDNVNVQDISPANDERGMYIVDCMGARYIQTKISTESVATSGNAFVGDVGDS